MIAIAVQMFLLAFPMRYLACFVELALGSHLNSITVAKDVTEDIKSFDTNHKALKSRLDMAKKLQKLINVHSMVKEFSNQSIIAWNFYNYSCIILINFLSIQLWSSSIQKDEHSILWLKPHFKKINLSKCWIWFIIM